MREYSKSFRVAVTKLHIMTITHWKYHFFYSFDFDAFTITIHFSIFLAYLKFYEFSGGGGGVKIIKIIDGGSGGGGGHGGGGGGQGGGWSGGGGGGGYSGGGGGGYSGGGGGGGGGENYLNINVVNWWLRFKTKLQSFLLVENLFSKAQLYCSSSYGLIMNQYSSRKSYGIESLLVKNVKALIFCNSIVDLKNICTFILKALSLS